MNRILSAHFAATLLCGTLMMLASSGALAQPQSASNMPPNAGAVSTNTRVKIAPGSVFLVKLTRSVNVKKEKKGDEVEARVTQDLRNAEGTVIIPKDSKVLGHVTEVQARSKEQKESKLAIAFNQAVLKNGEALQTPMSIQAIIAPYNPSDSASSAPAPVETRETTEAAPPGRAGPGVPPAGTTAPQTPTEPGEAPAGRRPTITGNTQGVVGIPNLKLAAASEANQGSLVTSERNNIKLDEGTFVLLRVIQ